MYLVVSCLVLLVLDVGLMLSMLSQFLPLSFHLTSAHLYSTPPVFYPFREKFFKVLVFEDVSRTFDWEFDRGVRDAASFLRSPSSIGRVVQHEVSWCDRVNVSIDRTDDISQAIDNIFEAQDALYDGLMISGFDDPSYVDAVKKAHEENPVMMLGSLEAYRTIDLKTLAHVGDEETNVGRLAGNVMQEAGMKVIAAVGSLQR